MASIGFEIDFLFDLEECVNENELAPIKQGLVDHNMCTPHCIHFGNDRFSKLLSDHRVLSRPDIIPRIIDAFQSLQQRQKETVSLVSSKENEALLGIKEYTKKMKVLKEGFDGISDEYQSKKAKNNKEIGNHINVCCDDLSAKLKEIRGSFSEILDALESKLEAVTKRLSAFYVDHREETLALDSNLKETERAIQHGLDSMEEQQMHCMEMLRDYNNHLSQRRTRTMHNDRDSKIIKIANHTKQCYDDALLIAERNQQKMDKFIQTKIRFDVDIASDVSEFNRIKNSIPRCIDKEEKKQ